MNNIHQSKRARKYMAKQRKKIEDKAKAHKLLCELNSRWILTGRFFNTIRRFP